MSVQLTPKGTRGVNIPKFPAPLMRIVQFFLGRRIKGQGGKLLDLITIGAKTGEERTTPLRYMNDGPDRWLVVASFGGATKHPAWYFNLSKNPDKVWITVDNQKIHVRAESIHGAEYTQLWKKIAAAAPSYADYQTKTDREIPIVRLTRVR